MKLFERLKRTADDIEKINKLAPQIIGAVVQEYNITEDELKGKSRKQKFVQPRFAATYIFYLAKCNIAYVPRLFNRHRSDGYHYMEAIHYHGNREAKRKAIKIAKNLSIAN